MIRAYGERPDLERATYDHGTNERIRALNADLGYVYLPRMVTLKGPLPPA